MKTIEQLHAEQLAARRNLSAKRKAKADALAALDEANRAFDAATTHAAEADGAVNAALDAETDQAPPAGQELAG